MRVNFLHLVLVACLQAAGALAAHAAEFVKPEEPDPEGGSPVIVGAQPVSPAQWPATLIFNTPLGGCTSTVVGQRVVLTAAHCVTNGEAGTVAVSGQSANVVCDHHPGYGRGNASTDFALCLASSDFSGFAFENVSASLAHARPGSDVTLLGYGCTQPGGFDRGFGVLHVGTASVVRGPLGDDIDTVTSGGAAVCFGDSGGAAYYVSQQQTSTRVIIGVNSRGDISRYSFLSSTATPAFVEWALQWTASKNAAICGLDADAKGCRP